VTKRLPIAERREQLVSAALEIAAAEGIGAVTIRRVAEQAEVALGVVHYAFADKDELFVALASRIVDDLAAAASSALEFDEDADLPTALRCAVHGLWDTIEQSREAQLLTYEITTYALRTAGLSHVATRQYEVSHAAVEALLVAAADVSRAVWTRPVDELAGEALAAIDGVTLRWLVDGDGAAAKARLAALADELAGHAKSSRRRRVSA
jgi:AcrR family transcriptional regulator